MSFEAYASVAASEHGSSVGQAPEIDRESRRRPAAQDLLPRLGAMRRMIGAEAFAVFTAPAGGAIAGGTLALVLEDRDDEGEGIKAGSAAGRKLLAHLESSALPLVWTAADDAAPTDRRRRRGLTETVMPGTTRGGIAFPVRFGSVGNGLVLFEGTALHLDPGVVFAVHRLAYRVMSDLLKEEISRSAPRQSLSERELECLQWAGGGCKSEAIADKLGLSVHTVNAYLGSATAKLDSVNRIQAIAKAIRLGFIA